MFLATSIGDYLTQYGFSLESMLVSIFIGLMLALAVLVYNKCVPGRIVRYLIKNGIHDESSAVTLEEAGLSKSLIIRASLKDGSMLRKLVACVPAKENGMNEKGQTDIAKARFYLPDETCHRADMIYNNNGTSVFTVLLTVLLFLVMMILLAILVPNLITMFKNFIDMFKSE